MDFDIVLLDISLQGRNGLELLEDIKRIKPILPVIMLSIYSEAQYAIRAMKLRASGYLNKASAPDELITTVFKVSQGGRYVSSSLAELLTDNLLKEKEDLIHKLSVREMEVVTLIASGTMIGSIAKEFTLSPKTISTYRTRILSKLDLNTTSDIIRYSISKVWKMSLCKL